MREDRTFYKPPAVPAMYDTGNPVQIEGPQGKLLWAPSQVMDRFEVHSEP